MHKVPEMGHMDRDMGMPMVHQMPNSLSTLIQSAKLNEGNIFKLTKLSLN